ncbi:PX domain-containing protein 1 isoform 1 [Mus musculus]|uniref:PX domain-containing protein 1 isoform 1 n=1 Tax=Mus musculus TaxID=10090 RepID=UPI0003D71C60|nr:PX domain-containing protein 1 isoform 1 [Mus musculus]|eukprot:XP_006516791.1 PREDICTED: PX domain-containing protein 1 isoform X1 [Mus musculus]
MASAVFEGTSLVNMFVRGCWVNGIRRLIVSRRGDEEEFFEIRTEWSDRSVLYLHRSFADLGRLCKRLRDAFPEDRSELARTPLRQGLLAIKGAHDIETRLNEVEKLLETVISMPCKYSRSEVVLTFFERSPLDQVLKNDNVHKIQPSFQSPVKISEAKEGTGALRTGVVDGCEPPEIMRSNGFCLANTETIVIDHSIPNGKDQLLDADSTEHLFENGGEFTSELEDGDDPEAYVTNLSYYHLVPFETDILD